MKIALVVSPNWKDYARRYLTACLASLREQSLSPDKVFLVDNESSVESMEYLTAVATAELPEINWEILYSPVNSGFAGGNNLALKKIIKSDYDYVVLVNIDGRMDKEMLSELVAAAEQAPEAGAIQARVMLFPDKEKVNSLGNATHYLGFGYCLGYRSSLESSEAERLNLSSIAYPSGAAVMLKCEALRRVGIFDEMFWMYNEDQDLGWRLWLNGWSCALASRAVFYHQYEYSRSTAKYYWMDRNRLINIFKHYRIKTLILISPALIVSGLGMMVSSWRGGWFKEQLRVLLYFFKPSTWRYLARARSESQSLRRVGDKEIIKLFSGKILYQEIDSPLVRAGNKLFNWYWKLAKRLIIW